MPSMEAPEGAFAEERKALRDFKKILLMTAGGAVKMQMDGQLDLKEEQEVVMNIADMMTDVFVAESLLLRVERLKQAGHQDVEVYEAMLQVFFTDAAARIGKCATDALASFAAGDLLKTFLMGVKRFSKYPPANVKQARRLIAERLIAHNEYCF